MALFDHVDEGGLLEYSVVFNDRSLNSMSKTFQGVMRDLSVGLKSAYNAEAAILVPGGGTFGMEAIARQFGTDAKCLVIRNGWFSFRWSEIFEKGRIASDTKVLYARQQATSDGSNTRQPFAPAPLSELQQQIADYRPDVVCAPHVETSAGMILPDDYIAGIADAAHKAGAIFVLDCVASGALYVDMAALGVDVLLTAPQKGWTASPCAGVVMLGKGGMARIEATTSTSYAADLKKWLTIMQAYENGGHAYHATMPTDGLRQFRDALHETRDIGFDKVKQAQIDLGVRMRALTESYGFMSVAAEGFKAPSVIVNFTDDPDLKSGKKFMQQGLQIAAGVPLEVGEPDDYMSFRIGLFGLDKLMNIDRTVASFEDALKKITA
ncbi:serine-pyruvate aminotransferase/archaeal aspartate aminotransferase [SAR116 cluster alpha proteobacterium HIMB100]|nr:serine-pyruvate aminotransferase/archaeal aspartate aminotransferase [SAR116 cluster alpha proteobacterium HIMB100]